MNRSNCSLLGSFPKRSSPLHFLKAKPVIPGTAFHQLPQIDPPVNQPSFIRRLFLILNNIAVDVTDIGQARHYAGAIRVAQAALHLVFVEKFRRDAVMGPVFLA